MKKTLATLFVLAGVLASGAYALRAQERVDLSVAETKPNNTAYHVAQMLLDVDNLSITVTLRGLNGESKTAVYNANTTPSGSTLLHQLNIGNFSVNSLMKAVYNRLITDGYLTGTISGVPQ